MGDSGSTDLDVKGLSLIDFSSENDSLIVSSSSATISGLNDHQSSETQNGPRSFELLGPVDADKEVEVAYTSGPSEELPQLPETLGPERTSKIGKCNLRKSLAWDSAFFTSAGVLDPEELSGMIEGAEKSKKHMLPGIEEDIRRSADSISTLASDTLTLESPEGDLFEDIRASIQKSHKANNVANSSSKKASAETDSQAFSSSTVDLTSQSKLKTKTALKKQTIGMQGSGKTIKQASGHPQVTQIKPVVRNKNSTSSLPKPPKTTSRANPVSTATTKRVSLGASRVKFENDNGKVASKGSMASKAPALGSSRGVVPKPALSSKSSSLSSSTATKTQPIRSSSSCDSSGSASSDNIGKSTLTSARRRINTRIVNPPSSGSILKTPSNTALKTRATSGDSALSVCLMSSNLSSSISHASSISEWSLESSSSTSTVNQMSNKPRASLNTSSCRSLASDVSPALNAKVHSNGQTSDGCENQANGPGQQTKKASAQNDILSRSAYMKPSGLRMPSPKIGFFDGAKSVVRTPNGSMKSHLGLPTGMAKIGTGICSPYGSGSKAKVGKLPPARTVMPITKMKPDMQTPVSPTPSEEPLNASTKVYNQSTDVRSCPSLSPGVPNEIGGRSCLKAVEVGTEETERAKHVPHSGLKAVMDENQGVLKIEMSLDAQGSVDSNDIKIVPIEGDTSDSSFNCFIEHSSPFRKAGEDAIDGLPHHKKENGEFEGQVDSMNKKVGDVNLKLEVQKELYVCDRKEESLTELSQPNSLSIAPSILKITASRTPFAVKNSSCNSEEIGFSKELSLLALENTATLPSSEIGSKENS